MIDKNIKLIATELSKKYNKREIFITALITENMKEGFSIKESKSILHDFFNQRDI